MRRRSFTLVLAATLVVIACIPGASDPSAPPSSSTGTATAAPSASPTPSGPSPSPSFVRPTPTPLPSFTIYTVKGGDNLSSIARTFETTPRSIAYWNGSTYPSLDPESEGYDPNRIEIGWVLQVMPGVEIPEDMIPTPAPTAAPTPATPSASPAAADVPSRRIALGSRSATVTLDDMAGV